MRNTKPQLEIIVLNVEDAIAAEKYHVDRLELVKELDKGGLTPDFEIIRNVSNAVDIPVYVMLRNLWDSYVYDEKEFRKILHQLEMIKLTKAKGIIFGSLNRDGTINEEQLKTIIDQKGSLELTFHRAIDSTIDYKQGIETLARYKEIDYVLTSGHAERAMDGMFNLSMASRILTDKIMIGSGVTPKNCNEFLQIYNIKKLHIGNAVRINRNIVNRLDEEAIRALKEAVDSKR